MDSVLISMGEWVRPHITNFALMIVATLLVIYGNHINQAIRRQVSGMHFIFRTLVFILVCAFGYGLLTQWLTPLLAGTLASISNQWLGLVSIVILVSLGVLAERGKQM